MIEVEFKFALPANLRTLLRSRLDTMPSIQRFAPVENVDIYYDTRNFSCFRQAVFLRVRDHARLEVKYHDLADPEHTHATERVFPLRLAASNMQDFNSLCSRFISGWQGAASIEAALALNGLLTLARIEKQRVRYVGKGLNLYVDHVIGLGDFFEVEMLCADDTGIEQARAQLQAFVASLDLPVLSAVRVGYVELWLRSHRPEVYYLGQYQLENVVPVPALSVNSRQS